VPKDHHVDIVCLLLSELLKLAIADLCITYESGRILAPCCEKEMTKATSLHTHRG
jgi:hypothetical protein